MQDCCKTFLIYEIERWMRYHQYRQRFLCRLYAFLVVLIHLVAIGALLSVIYLNVHYGIMALGILGIFAMDYIEQYSKKARLHRQAHLRLKGILSTAWEHSYTHLMSSTRCITNGKIEEPTYSALSARCYNETCLSNSLPITTLVPINRIYSLTQNLTPWAYVKFFSDSMYGIPTEDHI